MKSFLLAALAVVLASLDAPLFAQGRFLVIGEADSRATGISGDGTIVVGSYSQGGGAWRWTESGGLERLGGNAPPRPK